VGGNEKMGVFVAGVPSSLARRTPFFSRSPSPSPFTPATQASASIKKLSRIDTLTIDFTVVRNKIFSRNEK